MLQLQLIFKRAKSYKIFELFNTFGRMAGSGRTFQSYLRKMNSFYGEKEKEEKRDLICSNSFMNLELR